MWERCLARVSASLSDRIFRREPENSELARSCRRFQLGRGETGCRAEEFEVARRRCAAASLLAGVS